jgi:hypothetical protein
LRRIRGEAQLKAGRCSDRCCRGSRCGGADLYFGSAFEKRAEMELVWGQRFPAFGTAAFIRESVPGGQTTKRLAATGVDAGVALPRSTGPAWCTRACVVPAALPGEVKRKESRVHGARTRPFCLSRRFPPHAVCGARPWGQWQDEKKWRRCNGNQVVHTVDME